MEGAFELESWPIREFETQGTAAWEGSGVVGWFLNFVYLVLGILVLPWIAYQRLARGKYREGWGAKLFGLVPRRLDRRPCIWIHAVSVGEVNLLTPLVERFLREYPEYDCVISTTTATGMAVARTKFPELLVFHCPFDFTWATRRAVKRIQPELLILTELELWPNLIRSAKQFGAGVIMINGRLSKKSLHGYRLIGWLIGPVLRQIDRICVQTPVYGERFCRLGAEPGRVAVTGSMKFDGAETRRDNPQTSHLRRLAGISSDDVVFLAGSTQEAEERMALTTFMELVPEYPQLRLILVPRHPHRFNSVAWLLDELGVAWQRRSELNGRGPDPEARVLLVDTVGELRAWWGLAQIAFVGGSFGRRGGQNMIEPAAYGAAVCFGPHTHNFQDVVESLLAAEAAMVVHNPGELTTFVRWCLAYPEQARAMGDRARQVVLEHQGATDRTLQLLRPLLAHGQRRFRARSAA